MASVCEKIGFTSGNIHHRQYQHGVHLTFHPGYPAKQFTECMSRAGAGAGAAHQHLVRGSENSPHGLTPGIVPADGVKISRNRMQQRNDDILIGRFVEYVCHRVEEALTLPAEQPA